MTELTQIMFGAFLLSVIHATIPNHWIPLVALSKSEKWTDRFTLSITALAGFSHTLSTTIIGIIVGFMGYKLSTSYSLIISLIAPGILILLGIIYIIYGVKTKNNHHHTHEINEIDAKKKTKTAIILTIIISMFFSPCLEIEAYYFVAGNLGWEGIVTVSAVYTVITVAGMLFLVWLGMKGARKIKSHFLEHYEKVISGIVLIVLGIAGYFVK